MDAGVQMNPSAMTTEQKIMWHEEQISGLMRRQRECPTGRDVDGPTAPASQDKEGAAPATNRAYLSVAERYARHLLESIGYVVIDPSVSGSKPMT